MHRYLLCLLLLALTGCATTAPPRLSATPEEAPALSRTAALEAMRQHDMACSTMPYLNTSREVQGEVTTCVHPKTGAITTSVQYAQCWEVTVLGNSGVAAELDALMAEGGPVFLTKADAEAQAEVIKAAGVKGVLVGLTNTSRCFIRGELRVNAFRQHSVESLMAMRRQQQHQQGKAPPMLSAQPPTPGEAP